MFGSRVAVGCVRSDPFLRLFGLEIIWGSPLEGISSVNVGSPCSSRSEKLGKPIATSPGCLGVAARSSCGSHGARWSGSGGHGAFERQGELCGDKHGRPWAACAPERHAVRAGCGSSSGFAVVESSSKLRGDEHGRPWERAGARGRATGRGSDGLCGSRQERPGGDEQRMTKEEEGMRG